MHTGRGYISVLHPIVFDNLSSMGKQCSNDLVIGVILSCHIKQKVYGLSCLILERAVKHAYNFFFFFPPRIKYWRALIMGQVNLTNLCYDVQSIPKLEWRMFDLMYHAMLPNCVSHTSLTAATFEFQSF